MPELGQTPLTFVTWKEGRLRGKGERRLDGTPTFIHDIYIENNIHLWKFPSNVKIKFDLLSEDQI